MTVKWAYVDENKIPYSIQSCMKIETDQELQAYLPYDRKTAQIKNSVAASTL
jgi:hypothetical protein